MQTDIERKAPSNTDHVLIAWIRTQNSHVNKISKNCSAAASSPRSFSSVHTCTCCWKKNLTDIFYKNRHSLPRQKIVNTNQLTNSYWQSNVYLHWPKSRTVHTKSCLLGLDLTSIPSKQSLMTGTNASSTACEKVNKFSSWSFVSPWHASATFSLSLSGPGSYLEQSGLKKLSWKYPELLILLPLIPKGPDYRCATCG